jgi:hypothetical protein
MTRGNIVPGMIQLAFVPPPVNNTPPLAPGNQDQAIEDGIKHASRLTETKRHVVGYLPNYRNRIMNIIELIHHFHPEYTAFIVELISE